MTRHFFLSIIIVLCSPGYSFSVSWDVEGLKFSTSAYLDMEFTYTGKSPQVEKNAEGVGVISNDSIGAMKNFDQNHLNLLFDAQKERFRVHLNLSSRHAYSTVGKNGDFEFQEAYGDYNFKDLLKVRAGNFLSPFGIYNEVRYITPLFATVVLPQMYEVPNYEDTPLYPNNANIMLYGTLFTKNVDIDYSLYAGSQNTDPETQTIDKDEIFGGRLKFTILKDYRVGFSTLVVEREKGGRRLEYGGDLDIPLSHMLFLEAEYLYDSYESKFRKNRMSYYARLSYRRGELTTFVGFDHFKDRGNTLYQKGMDRFGTGFGYYLSKFATGKVEYHYHRLRDEEGVPDGTGTFSMLRASIIFTI